ncbi:Nif3-like dinuclear metal center hexameric protein [Bacillus sp. FJAT-49736]|uniref:Nif3-like dinuclear metal center hexameric protein n=1 Tax=Bacillus sp. FJAT-49736 TaxID=2833582 RepID=UPI001BC9F57A|nr:Nif3-like dinuclear metal center hexameric protein [Bacillus sp. FJAT-49736]MBS4174374.1 Nif3-like dinuclear metal center hexameric protein [Bacillus sp. FJAT-49736]
MVKLNDIVLKLDQEFEIKSFGKDSAFSRFLPGVYDPIHFDWQQFFEKDFTQFFNGLMLRGLEDVEKVFLAVFPTDEVLERFIEEGTKGDLLFMHHPLVMECGDPRGKWGRGFVPIPEDYLKRIKEKDLSVYTCHVPMDYHQELGTNAAMAKQLGAVVTDGFLKNEKGQSLIYVCDIPAVPTDEIIAKLLKDYEIPYVDFEGKKQQEIKKIAIVAGCGDKVEWMKEAESLGVQAYITGEIHCHIDNDYGRHKYALMKEYAKETTMSLIGVSHSASEYMVVKTLMKSWFENHFSLPTVLLPQSQWWL